MGVQFNPTNPVRARKSLTDSGLNMYSLAWSKCSVNGSIYCGRIYPSPIKGLYYQGVGNSCLLIHEICFLDFYTFVTVFFYFSEISPNYFCNKKNNIGNFIGREIKVNHIALTSLYEANLKVRINPHLKCGW